MKGDFSSLRAGRERQRPGGAVPAGPRHPRRRPHGRRADRARLADAGGARRRSGRGWRRYPLRSRTASGWTPRPRSGGEVHLRCDPGRIWADGVLLRLPGDRPTPPRPWTASPPTSTRRWRRHRIRHRRRRARRGASGGGAGGAERLPGARTACWSPPSAAPTPRSASPPATPSGCCGWGRARTAARSSERIAGRPGGEGPPQRHARPAGGSRRRLPHGGGRRLHRLRARPLPRRDRRGLRRPTALQVVADQRRARGPRALPGRPAAAGW